MFPTWPLPCCNPDKRLLLAALPPAPALHQLRPTISPRSRQSVSCKHLLFPANIFWSLFIIKPLTAWLRHASGATLFVTALVSVEKADRMRCLLFVPSRAGSHQYCRIVHNPSHSHQSISPSFGFHHPQHKAFQFKAAH